VTLDPTRRRFVSWCVATLASLPGIARAQDKGGMRRVALLFGSNPEATSHWLKALGGGLDLDALGWKEGRNLVLDASYAEGDPSRYRPLAKALLDRKPDVIVAGTETIAREAMAATKTVPIVFAIGFDPVGTGLVQSLARPGANVTGLSLMSLELMPKRLQLLKEALPRLARVALLYRKGDPNSDRVLASLAEPARSLGLAIVPGGVGDPGEIERAFEQFAREKASGILVVPDVFFFQHAARVMGLAIKHKLACGAGAIEYARAGALFSYGPDFAATFRYLARVVDKILKGARPADIPVEQPNVYELAVNLRTAAALGIRLPPALMAQVTQTIE
jgi:putative ABC transport system substrate-binding protein